MSKPPRPSRHRFWEARVGNTGDLSCLEHATESSPPRSADGYSAADTPPSGFPAAGLLKAPLDCSFDTRAEGALTIARTPLSFVLGTGASCTSGTYYHPLLSLPLSTACCISPCCHTLRRHTLRRRSSTVRTLCLPREKWDHDPPTVLTANLTINTIKFNYKGASPTKLRPAANEKYYLQTSGLPMPRVG